MNIDEWKIEFRRRLAESEARDDVAVSNVAVDFLKWSLTNFDALEEGAQKHVYAVVDTLREGVKAAADARSDSPQTRLMHRMAAGDEKPYLKAKRLIQALVGETKHPKELIESPMEAFLLILQDVLDMLFDVTRLIRSGTAELTNLALSYSAIDELLAGFHLAQRGFVSQAYSHIRSVHEVLDKIKLFHQQPQWIELWASGNEKQIYHELRPAAVRKKLGNPKHDPLYSFFSSLGPHGTFESVQIRMVKRAGQDDCTQPAKVQMSVGGHSPFKVHIVWVNTFCAFTALSLSMAAANVFSHHLNQEELAIKLPASAQVFERLIREYFVVWTEREGISTLKILQFLNKHPWEPKSS